MSAVQNVALVPSQSANSDLIPLSQRVVRFRIMCERADGSISLVRIVTSMSEARGLCQQLTVKHLQRLKTQRAQVVARPDRPRRLYFERWIGNDHCGHWDMVDPSNDGFVFHFLDQAPKINLSTNHGTRAPSTKTPAQGAQAAVRSKTTNNSALMVAKSADATIRSGMLVSCELQAVRTRKGGWMAKVIGRDLCGPITNSHMLPTTVAAGDTVQLRVCGVKAKTGFIQLAWPTVA